MRSVSLLGARRLAPVLLLALAAAGVAAACSDSNDAAPGGADVDAASDAPLSTTKDAQQDTSTSTPDDARADAEEPSTTADEVEPNNGTTTTEIGVMKLPGTMNGKIDPANDVDIFSVDLAPGDFWEWKATPTSADLAPHVVVFDTVGAASKNPTVAGFAGAGAPATVQHFVLHTGKFVVGVRDARNVGAAGGKGGPTYGYSLVAKRKTPQPISVTFPTTKTGKLASVGSVDLYTFTGTGGKGWDIVIRADRKASPSTLDARLSLFDLTAKKAVITNDKAGSSTNDAQVGSADPAPSTYLVIVENEGTDGADLSYEIDFTNR
jgi:hypothetical protein